MNNTLTAIIDYHQRTKHHLDRSARSLGYLDWATQPDPFRRFADATLHRLDFVDPADQPYYDAIFDPGRTPARPFDRAAVSQLFFDSMALSAWKEFRGNRWALRCNPSSGNLHPTEAYLIAPPVDGLTGEPGLYHYSPHEHGLEKRATFEVDAAYVGLTSIYWRESWKYGERAFRYCHHDVGHAIAAIAIAAALLGWRARLVGCFDDDALARLMGVETQIGIEAEHPDCLIALDRNDVVSLNPAPLQLTGEPNRLSDSHHDWAIIDKVSTAAHRSVTSAGFEYPLGHPPADHGEVSARKIIRQRRSAVDMDGRTGIDHATFNRMLGAVMPGHAPFDTLTWRPCVHLAIFVHRVADLAPGLYMLVRNEDDEQRLRAACHDEFTWQRIGELPLYRLTESDVRQAAKLVSCNQDIASDGAFAMAMIVDFRTQLETHGAWFYKRLFWETGMLGQVLYLEAEAAGVSSTGIGCFFDDAMHDVLGIDDLAFQSLYHFTVGQRVDDLRLQTHPPYAHLHQSPSQGD